LIPLTTNAQDIMGFLRKLIADLTENPMLEQQLGDDQLIQESGMDSLRIINLIVQIELNYEVAFDDEELLTENFATLNLIHKQIKQKLDVTL
jgi:acyl carrier protein